MKSKKEKIVEKMAAKKAKLKAKLIGSAKTVATAATLIALTLFVGCQSVPSRSQTQTFKDCTFYIGAAPAVAAADDASGGEAGTNAVAASTQPFSVGGDLLVQNQVVENSGTETLNPTHTISPQTTATVPVGTGGSELATELGAAGGTAIKSLFSSSSSTNSAAGN